MDYNKKGKTAINSNLDFGRFWILHAKWRKQKKCGCIQSASCLYHTALNTCLREVLDLSLAVKWLLKTHFKHSAARVTFKNLPAAVTMC